MGFSLGRVATGIATGGLSEAYNALSPKSMSAPGLSPQEQQLRQMQLDMLMGAQKDSTSMSPLMLAMMGLKQNTDGSFAQMTPEEQNAAVPPEYKPLLQLYQSHAQDALSAEQGKLPAFMQSQIDKESDLTGASLSRRLGSNWQGSTAGIQTAQSQLKRNANLASEYSQQATGLLGADLGNMQSVYGQYGNYANRNLGLIGAASGAMAPYQQDTLTQAQINAQNAANNAQFTSGLMGLGGTVIGAGVGGAFRGRGTMNTPVE